MASPNRPGYTTYETPTENEIVITRIVAAPRRVVFDAWTNPEHVPKWLSGWDGWTMPVCEIDLRPGGKWRYVWRKSSDGAEMAMEGDFREVTPPERLVTSESWGPEWPVTINTLVLTETSGQTGAASARPMTTSTLTVTYPSKEARDAALKTGMKDGMDLSWARLDELVATLS